MTVIVLDFGGQYNQLIARRVREANVYSEILPYTTPIDEIAKYNPQGIIFTGGPNSAYEEGAPSIGKEIFELGIPILGICYGAQVMSLVLGGSVHSVEHREYGFTSVEVDTKSMLFDGLEKEQVCWMSHTDQIDSLPDGFEVCATTPTCPVAAMYNEDKKLYAVQFHPEVGHTKKGQEMLVNFLYNVCKCKGEWTMSNIAKQSIIDLKEKIGDRKVLLALSGGVDSSVAAVMLSKAIGKNLTCIFVDHGLLRKDEGDQVEKVFTDGFDLNFIRVNAQDRFLSKLENVEDPEKKRKIIGEEFIRVFEEEAKKLGKVHFLAQGTIYPDVVESGVGHAAVIKSHHNVGGLPDHVDFEEIIEPLRDLFKDEVRKVGLELGLSEELVWRQPFPGPGLAIRIMGAVTKDKLEILKEADYIYRQEIKNAGLNREIWQYFAALTNTRTVGVMGDARTYDYVLALRAVTSVDAMTADWARIPHEVLAKISNRIINEVPHVNRIVYDITSKPPGTIEWE
ncbi:MAG: glutamine-hydrolyzing GMP synthase [Eubacteriales bacterium]